MWEYKIVHYDIAREDGEYVLQKMLATLGRERWELVLMSRNNYIFKRPTLTATPAGIAERARRVGMTKP